MKNMIINCINNGLSEWDQVLVDQYNREQEARGGLIVKVDHTAEEAFQILSINEST